MKRWYWRTFRCTRKNRHEWMIPTADYLNQRPSARRVCCWCGKKKWQLPPEHAAQHPLAYRTGWEDA